MRVKITGTAVKGIVNAIPSKSYAHRISICNFLAGKLPKSGAVGVLSKDITATEDCLTRVMRGISTLDCGESGSTLRFLLPLLASLGGEYTLIGHGKLMERPNDELFKVLNSHGVTTEKTDFIKIKGKLTAGEYKIRGDISSQYVSGLLMALPTLSGDSKILLTTPLASAPYVDITIQVLESYGVKIVREENGYFISGNQKYQGDISPEGDWSNSAFFLVLGAVAGDVTVKGLNLNSVQGDRRIMDLLKLVGADVSAFGDSVRVKKSDLSAFTFDFEDCPDMVPIASVLASNANGTSVIKNIERLRIKESDRVKTTMDMLKSFGIESSCDGKDLTVHGGGLTAGVAKSYNDHRIAMSSAVLAVVADGESEIVDATAVNKSYPEFYKDLEKVGVSVIEL